MALYSNATDCQEIRQKAEGRALDWAFFLLTIEGSTLFFNTVELLIGLYLCIRILTVPVIMDKMNDVINFLLPLPALGSIAVGINLRTHAELGVSHDWMSKWFIVVGICQCVVMPFGIAAGRMKNRLALRGYQVLQSAVFGALIFLGVSAIVYAFGLEAFYQKSGQGVNNAACAANLDACCCCDLRDDDSEQRCPEWTEAEIIEKLRVDLMLAGLTALFGSFFTTWGIVAAELLHRNLKDYKVAYV